MIRTQGFGYPLFALTLWLLADAARGRSGRRVYWVFAVLVLWANLHGSVTMGVALAMIYGATVLAAAFRARRLQGLLSVRGLTFLAGAPLCLLATPYGFSIIDYYRSTLLNPEFGKLVTEWQPVTTYTLIAVPFVALVLVAVWTLGRSGARTPAFDQLALVLLGFAGVFAVRNITWFGLGAMLLLPSAIATVARPKPPAARRVKLNLAISLTSLALILVTILATLAHPGSWFERTYPARGVATVERLLAKDPGAKVFADVRFADWLVWNDPAIAGHIAYDTSLELLTTAQLSSLATLGNALAPGARDPIGPYSVLVLDPADKSVDRILLARAHAAVLLRSKRVIIATKAAT